jgi:transposase
MVNWALKALDGRFNELDDESDTSQTSAERQLQGLLLQTICTIRGEPMLMEQLDYNLPFRWFVGLGHQTRSCCSRRSTGRSGHGYWKARWPRQMEEGAVHSLTSV